MSHTLTITKVPDEVDDDYEYTISGEHEDDCAVWFECDRMDCPTKSEDFDDPAGEGVWHGEDHIAFDDVWATKSTQCAIDYRNDRMIEQLDGREVGTYDVEVGYWGDGEWYFNLTPEKSDS